MLNGRYVKEFLKKKGGTYLTKKFKKILLSLFAVMLVAASATAVMADITQLDGVIYWYNGGTDASSNTSTTITTTIDGINTSHTVQSSLTDVPTYDGYTLVGWSYTQMEPLTVAPEGGKVFTSGDSISPLTDADVTTTTDTYTYLNLYAVWAYDHDGDGAADYSEIITGTGGLTVTIGNTPDLSTVELEGYDLGDYDSVEIYEEFSNYDLTTDGTYTIVLILSDENGEIFVSCELVVEVLVIEEESDGGTVVEEEEEEEEEVATGDVTYIPDTATKTRPVVTGGHGCDAIEGEDELVAMVAANFRNIVSEN